MDTVKSVRVHAAHAGHEGPAGAEERLRRMHLFCGLLPEKLHC